MPTASDRWIGPSIPTPPWMRFSLETMRDYAAMNDDWRCGFVVRCADGDISVRVKVRPTIYGKEDKVEQGRYAVLMQLQEQIAKQLAVLALEQD